MTSFDLLIRGGELVDPGAGRRGRLDIGLRDGLVAAVGEQLPAEAAAQVVDADGLLVVPGLVDLHTHVYAGVTYWGVDPDALAPRCGVTSWVDAGSAGGYTIGGLERYVAAPAAVRVRAFLNLSSIGLVAPSWELAGLHHLDEALCLRAAAEHASLVVGLKVRIDRFTVGANGIEPLLVARRVAERAGLPLMVHVAQGPPAIGEVLALLRGGDVLTHCATGQSMRLVDDAGRPVRGLREAVERGVVLDVGHGSGSFSWRSAEALLAAGLPPSVISSDVHQLSVNGPMFDLPTCLAKALALGLRLEDAIAAATCRPAALLGEAGRLGTLREGAAGDVCLLAAEPGPFPVFDVLGERREAPLRLRAVRTFVAGRELEPRPWPPPAWWVELTPAQRALRERAARGEPVDLPAELAPHDLATPAPPGPAGVLPRQARPSAASSSAALQ